MAHAKKTDSEVNSIEVHFVEKPNENAEMLEKMMKRVLTEMMDKKLTDLEERIVRDLTDYQGEICK